MKQFLFSFIIIIDNVKPYFVETMESIIAQSVGFAENIQIVLAHDSSHNDLETACEHYRNLYPDNILSIEKLANPSLAAVRNSGLKVATGQYINFLNPGDNWDKEACQAALDFFQKNPKIRLACFPIMLFGASKGKHWLNYKFTKTRVANIFKDQDCAIFDLCSCFCTRELVKDDFLKRPFLNQSLPASEESVWIAKALIDEQNFGLIAKPYCRCRFDRSSSVEVKADHLSSTLDTLRLRHLEILNYAKERYGEIPPWIQYGVMLDLTWMIKQRDRNIFTSAQKEEYKRAIRSCLTLIDDQIICTVRNIVDQERMCTLALKYDMSYEQIKEWIRVEEKAGGVWFCFCRPGTAPLPFSQALTLWVGFMDIAERRLVLHGGCVAFIPAERMSLVLEVEYQDNSRQEYPCELFRSPERRKQYVFADELWAVENFEISLPLDVSIIRSFLQIDGKKCELKWKHTNLSPFAQGDEKLFWERSGYTVSQLPESTGIRIESWTGDSKFLFSFIIPAYNVKPYLAEAVESVIAQTIGFEENIQIVLVNDGSTDGTGAVCKRYRDLWPDNIIYIEKPNGGVSSARNAGIKVATGRYINLPDADDKWDPTVCQAALDFFEAHPEVNIVCFPIMFFDRRENAHWLNYKFKQTKVSNIFKDMDYAVLSVHHCILKNESAKNNGTFDESLSIAEDSKWITRLIL